MNIPEYMVQTQDGQLHCYWTTEILRIDLAINKGESVKVFRRAHGIPLRYFEIPANQLSDWQLEAV